MTEESTEESTGYEVTYNLFRRKGRSRLHCAVPQDWNVPAFINETAWDFVGAFSAHTLLGAVGAYAGLLAAPVSGLSAVRSISVSTSG
jgi:hypothetical protein